MIALERLHKGDVVAYKGQVSVVEHVHLSTGRVSLVRVMPEPFMLNTRHAVDAVELHPTDTEVCTCAGLGFAHFEAYHADHPRRFDEGPRE